MAKRKQQFDELEFYEKTEIRKAFYNCALKYHPDKNPDNIEWATTMMQKINAAYELLK